MATMKKQIFVIALASICLGFASSTVHAQTIAPYGDSVTTFGNTPESSYRYWLYKYLTDAGLSCNYIGTKSGVEDGAPANSWPDEAFSGHEGWTSSDAVYGPNLNAVVGMSPDIVLLDFGSNDIINGDSVSETTEPNLEAIIQAFAAQNANVIIVIAKPTPFRPDPTLPQKERSAERQKQSRLTSIVSKVANVEHKAGVHVITVNLFSGFNVQRDTKDGSHPNVRGEQMIAKKYFVVLKKILKNW
jgi:hypothetical protein